MSQAPRRRARRALQWSRIHWIRPVEPDRALELVRRLASDARSPLVAFEARSTAAGVDYFVGTPYGLTDDVAALFADQVPGTRLTPVTTTALRPVPQSARRLKASTRQRSLRIKHPEARSRQLLTALSRPREGEALVLQVVLGPRRVPLAVPTNSPSSTTAPWWFALSHGDGGTIDSEKRTALRQKVSDHGFACTVRIGVNAATAGRRRQLGEGVVAALHASEAPGVRVHVRHQRPAAMQHVSASWLWPLRLNAAEVLTLTAWPFGDDDLPGAAAVHPRRLPPSPGTTCERPTAERLMVAVSAAPGVDQYLSQAPDEALRHTHVLAPTGGGKSVLLGRLIEQDIAAGRGVVVIEPKGDLVRDVLEHIPKHREADVVVLDPAANAPIGLNPIVSPGRSPEVIADGLLSVFRGLYSDSWGPRLQDVLHASLLTLARRRDATLVMLPLLLTNTGFRRSLTQHLNDPIALGPFWHWYENLSEAERASVIAPLMNKLRPWLFDPRIRAVLGQRQPRFDIRDVFTQRRILLVPLRSGVIGNESARLLGSLVVAQLWEAIRGRAAIEPGKRHPVMVTIDEVQDYLGIADIGEALAVARGYGAGFRLAHQALQQLPLDLRAGVLTNARTRILFQLGHDDATVMARGHPEITPEDLTSLGPYEIYASLFSRGRVTPYAIGRSLPPAPAISDPKALERASQTRYGQPLDEVEAGITTLVTSQPAPPGRPGRPGRPGQAAPSAPSAPTGDSASIRHDAAATGHTTNGINKWDDAAVAIPPTTPGQAAPIGRRPRPGLSPELPIDQPGTEPATGPEPEPHGGEQP